MIDDQSHEISVEKLMEHIRREARRRRPPGDEGPSAVSEPADAGQTVAIDTPAEHPCDDSLLKESPPLPPMVGEYSVGDFSRYHDRDFIQNAYRGILKREPDAPSFAGYLEHLRQGAMTKSEILCQLRYSREGRAKGVKVRGLLLLAVSHKFFKLPLLGYALRWVAYLVRLPSIVRHFHTVEAQNQMLFSLFRDYLRQEDACLKAKIGEIKNYQSLIEEIVTRMSDVKALAAQKADARYLEEMDASKAAQSDVDDFKSQHEAEMERLFGLIVSKIGKAEYESLMALKADRAELESMAVLKVDRAELENIAGLKADRAELETIAALKVDRAELENITRLKVDRAELESSVALKADRADLEGMGALKADRAEVENLAAVKADLKHIEAIHTRLGQLTQGIDHLRRASVEQERRLWLFLEEARKRLPEPFSTDQLAGFASEEDHLLDAFYVAFEDNFRGTREDIKEKLGCYLPYMTEIEGAEERVGPVLDLGCGRGEWLELLKEHRLGGLGIDCNPVMVSLCREKGLEAVEADVLEFLRSQKNGSFGAVTGFHIIEHLPLLDMIKVFDETFRVLKPGGVMIFETPNPTNILVGASTFYMDPTHRNPLYPASVAFIAEFRGFSQVKILHLNPPPDYNRIDEEGSPVAGRFNEYFYGPRDYAVIGYKS
ncbi:methyltransferase domain-containing protein [Desulforhabdus sp. TSK]|uniref:methyltransferase domain-containing protein n=1 Tax=Desulforhabdus sp. TSK TaxID=2925014 RepID=UPI001FC84A2B|nr:methyltransferase domain-containing protein [Desulforhabdus sp. TSK]GKT10729.1 hypothetical protein DSTSK_40340 [Desulforhabdus sp. TSK]